MGRSWFWLLARSSFASAFTRAGRGNRTGQDQARTVGRAGGPDAWSGDPGVI